MKVNCQLQFSVFLSKVNNAPAVLPPRKEPWYPLDRRLGGPHILSGCCEEKKNPTLRGMKPWYFRCPVMTKLNSNKFLS
jgi:hypothetical protein